jgi:hypothetical protein
MVIWLPCKIQTIAFSRKRWGSVVKMNRNAWAMTAAALTLLTVAPHAQPANDDAVRVYDSTELALERYTVIKRVPVQGWKSAFWVGGHADAAAARQSVVDEAARVGADGVINLKCYSQTDLLIKYDGYYCYGNAIKLKNEVRVR